MIVNAISQLGTRLLDPNRSRGTTGGSRKRKFMSIRATHGAAYNAAIVDEVDVEDSSSPASPRVAIRADDLASDPFGADDRVIAVHASPGVSRRVATLADVEDAYDSN
jgi:hypothetical protein